jgi:hypothetical protein
MSPRPICDRFTFDYRIEGLGGEIRPDMRYCTCGWTEQHHIDERAATLVESE